jgi:eukaryotic-like serine/threonine-protein kinase
MGVVDLAVDQHGQPVALKHLVLQGSAAEMAQARQRIRREAEALSRLSHPHIVGLIDVIDEGDEVVLVMPYLEGGTLADHVRENGPLEAGQVALLADTVLHALATAHRHGVVHRDIKPANVLFDSGGRAYLADFGVATFRDATSGLTATGSLVGTPEFMAPEQARGERATPASDVFSMGATLLYAATGRPPYGEIDPRVVIHRASRGRLAPIPSTLDRSLRRRLLPMLRREPSRRPSAAEAIQGPAGTQVAAPRPPRRHRRAIATTAAALVAAVVAVGALLALTRDSEGPSGAAASPISVAPPTSACRDLPYQPCGEPPAPKTDGTRCVDGHADYDGDPRNGCEAVPDDVDGRRFDRTITATLVPADDVDRYPTPVSDNFQLLCNGVFQVTLISPAGTSVRVELLEGDRVLGQAVSTNGSRAKVSLEEPSCGGDDSATLTTQVSWVGEERSAGSYTLERSGSF